MRQTNYKLEAIAVLKQLANTYPNQLLSTHISLALSEYPNFDGISDKEFYFILEKYRCEKELDMNIASDADVESIINDSRNLTLENLLDDEDEDY